MFDSKFDACYKVNEEQWTLTLLRNHQQAIVFIERVDQQYQNGLVEAFCIDERGELIVTQREYAHVEEVSRENLIRELVGYSEEDFEESSTWYLTPEKAFDLMDDLRSGGQAEVEVSLRRKWVEDKLEAKGIFPGGLISEGPNYKKINSNTSWLTSLFSSAIKSKAFWFRLAAVSGVFLLLFSSNSVPDLGVSVFPKNNPG